MSEDTIIGMQRRVTRVAKLRMGTAERNAAGHVVPGSIVKLVNWRLTSGDRKYLEDVAALYGGEVKPWTREQGAPNAGLGQVFTTTRNLPVAMKPDLLQAIRQNFELWDKATCVRRCNGETERLNNVPCLCRGEGKDPTDPQGGSKCKPFTRLQVWLYEAPGVGVAELTTQGYNAAMELPLTAEVMEAATIAGGWVTGHLRIDHRSSKTMSGKMRQYVVPVLSLDARLTERQALGAGVVAPALGAGSEVPSSVTPAPPASPSEGEPEDADWTHVEPDPVPPEIRARVRSDASPESGGGDPE